MIHLLPIEMADCISLYLSTRDIFQLSIVNHAFRTMFTASLYKTIKFCNLKDFENFLSIPSRPFQYVRQLDLWFNMNKENQLQNLSSLLPLLDSFALNISDSPKLFEQVYPSLQHLTTLHLEISYDYDEEVNHDDELIHFIICLLKTTPNLTVLSVFLSTQQLSVYLLDCINFECPLIEHLSVVADTVRTPDTMSMAVHHFPHLKSFELSALFSLPVHPGWLRYVGDRYPNIERLKLGANDVSIGSIFSPELYDRFFSSCPRLVYFDWHNILPDSFFLQRLSQSQRQAQYITLSRPDYIMDHLLGASSSRTAYFSNIMNLDIYLPEEMACDTFFSSLANACPQLQQIKVKSFCYYPVNQISIGTLLDSFPCVTLLQLEGIQLCHSNHNLPVSHPLRNLTLKHSGLSDKEINALVIRCPDLERMTLSEINHEEEGSLMVHLPYLTFTLLDLSRIFMRHDVIYAVNQLFYVEQQKASGWYRLSSKQITKVSKEQLISACRELDTDEKERLKTISPRIYALLDGSLCTLESNSHLVEAIKMGYIEIVCPFIRSIYIQDNKISNS
ncbi:hypothetical protein A0J61_04371 [Choanephora cucurbitarum]|uniref:F-box domain-containing protein n=1 Tax=Choanephora cucurbitarum TaxID=101091 RepID=A0A1C7NF44_9FUNG|nr:hypothetical protein A0J61_04371 [Choanephora cucurbitarum]